MRRRKLRAKREFKPIHLVVVDGETEKWYLDLFKEKESLTNFKVDPELCMKRNLAEQYSVIKENADIYHRVTWIIDLDVIIKEALETRKGEKTPINKLKEYIVELNKHGNIEILINAPCLEFWYLLHIKATSRYYKDYNSLYKEFKGTILDGYQKTEKFYKQRSNDIYSKLKPYFNNAKSNASQLGDFDFENPQKAIAEIHKLFYVLKPEDQNK